MICLALILRARQRARTARQQTQQTLPSVGAGVFQRRRGSEAARFRASPSPRFRGLFGLPGHFPPSSPRRSRLVARFVAVILFSPRSVSSLGFSRSACVFRLGVEASGGSEAVLRSFPRLREPPPPPRHSGKAVLVTTSLREAGWVVTAAPPVLCLDCAWTIATRALEQRSVAASAIFNVPTRSSHWLCLAGDEVRAAAGRGRSAAVVL